MEVTPQMILLTLLAAILLFVAAIKIGMRGTRDSGKDNQDD